MNTLRDIAEKLYNANNILLYPHVGTDGDAVGSCVAIAKALRTMGKTAYALYEEEIPGNLSFMLNDPEGKPYFTSDPSSPIRTSSGQRRPHFVWIITAHP